MYSADTAHSAELAGGNALRDNPSRPKASFFIISPERHGSNVNENESY